MFSFKVIEIERDLIEWANGKDPPEGGPNPDQPRH